MDHGINELSISERWYDVGRYSNEEFNKMRVKLQQHEDLIIQLVEITAATNRKLYAITERQTELKEEKNLQSINSS